jgi:hypothetical protein
MAQLDATGTNLDSLNALLDSAIVSAKRILEHHGGASSSTDGLVVSFASGDLPELLRQAEEKSLSLRGEMHAMAKAAAVDQLEEGLVQSAVAESSAHIQEQQQQVDRILKKAPTKVCGNPDCTNTKWTASMKGVFKKCARCLVVKYCSESCQRVHWKEHKKVCKNN